MKLCKDCVNYNEYGNLCVRGKTQVGTEPVYGFPLYEYSCNQPAQYERGNNWWWHCGKNARFFEAK